MDTLAHAAMGALFFSRSGVCAVRHPIDVPFWKDWTFWAAAGFGSLPDLSSFGAYFVQRFFQEGGVSLTTPPPLETLPAYVPLNYTWTHSLVVALVVGIFIYRLWKPGFLPFLAWPLHILCDIPVHGTAYFATPFLWPLSDWRFDGWSFGKYRWIVAVYWAVIIGVWIWRMVMVRKRTVKK